MHATTTMHDRNRGSRSLRTRLCVAATCGLGVLAGCGTTRLTDTQRTATEQLLVSKAIDQVVGDLNFQCLAGKTVYFDPQYLDGTVDRGYLVSSLRQQLLACGCVLQEERSKATYVVEVRSGGVGTDRHAVLLGIPQMNVPTFAPGQPSQIPEIPFAKKTEQEGVAKIAVFAYNRTTGQPVWQSGVVQATSTSKDTWVLGAGPFQRGSIRNGTEFAGEQISIFTDKGAIDGERRPATVPLTRAVAWAEMPFPKTDSKRLAVLLGAVPLSERPRAGESNPSQTPSALVSGPTAPPPPSAPSAIVSPNNGGDAESEPSKIMTAGWGEVPPGPQTESEPGKVADSATGFKPEK